MPRTGPFIDARGKAAQLPQRTKLAHSKMNTTYDLPTPEDFVKKNRKSSSSSSAVLSNPTQSSSPPPKNIGSLPAEVKRYIRYLEDQNRQLLREREDLLYRVQESDRKIRETYEGLRQRIENNPNLGPREKSGILDYAKQGFGAALGVIAAFVLVDLTLGALSGVAATAAPPPPEPYEPSPPQDYSRGLNSNNNNSMVANQGDNDQGLDFDFEGGATSNRLQKRRGNKNKSTKSKRISEPSA